VTLDAQDREAQNTLGNSMEPRELVTPFHYFLKTWKRQSPHTARLLTASSSGAGPHGGANQNTRGVGALGVNGSGGGWCR
jgi:hypothetical protein